MTRDKIFDTWNRKNPHKKTLYKRTNEEMNTFYGKQNIAKWARQFHWVHYTLKYKIIVPAIKILYKKYSTKITKEIPNKPQFKYVKLWDKIFDEATIKWREVYINDLPGNKKHLTKEQITKDYNATTGNPAVMRKIKEILNTMLLNDDAYAEWLPFFLWETYNTMREEIPNMKDKNTNKIYHLLHHTQEGLMDPKQEIIYLKLIKQTNYGLIIPPQEENK